MRACVGGQARIHVASTCTDPQAELETQKQKANRGKGLLKTMQILEAHLALYEQKLKSAEAAVQLLEADLAESNKANASLQAKLQQCLARAADERECDEEETEPEFEPLQDLMDEIAGMVTKQQHDETAYALQECRAFWRTCFHVHATVGQHAHAHACNGVL